MARSVIHRMLDGIASAVFNLEDDRVLVFGKLPPQRSAIMATVHPRPLWEKQRPLAKLRSLVSGKWEPDVDTEAANILAKDLFGGPEDYGDKLMALMYWHGHRSWDLGSLTQEDWQRAEALFALAHLARLNCSSLRFDPPVNVRLPERQDLLCALVFPMAVKVPVVSLRYGLEAHFAFAFAQVRRAKHPMAEQIIGRLYDLLALQQKTALSLVDYAKAAAAIPGSKGDAVFTLNEIDAIRHADVIIVYLKASIEKTLALVAETHEIAGLDSKKDHGSRLRKLTQSLPEKVKETGYCTFLLHHVDSSQLEELNRLRTGLLHKKGIAALQPHGFIGVRSADTPLRSLFVTLREQHAKNTALLIAALALLADDLVRRDPPTDEEGSSLQELMLGALSPHDGGHVAGANAEGTDA